MEGRCTLHITQRYSSLSVASQALAFAGKVKMIMSRYLVLQPKLYGAGLLFHALFEGSDLSFILNFMLVQ